MVFLVTSCDAGDQARLKTRKQETEKRSVCASLILMTDPTILPGGTPKKCGWDARPTS